MTATETATAILQRWKTGIDARHPDDVGALFTADALFQGLRPAPLYGPSGVSQYYAEQPVGLRVDYTVLHSRHVSDDVITAFVAADFQFSDGRVIPTRITVVLLHGTDGWRIDHYHVSPITQY